MSRPWWSKERVIRTHPRGAIAAGEFGRRPMLVTESVLAIVNELRRRRPTYTPDWSDLAEHDAGVALVELFAFQLSSISRRVNRLPDKALLEFIRAAGLQPDIAMPSGGIVAFSLAPTAPESVPILRGFQVGAAPANGAGDTVVFETQNDLMASPGELAKVLFDGVRGQRDLTALNKPGSSFAPFGERPIVGDALLLGLKISERARIRKSLTLGLHRTEASGNPPPASAGGVNPSNAQQPVTLQWEARVGSQFQPIQVDQDETLNLTKSGIVQLRVPDQLGPSKLFGDESLVWFRVRIVHGQYDTAPQLSLIQINAARILAVQTIRDEVLQPVNIREGHQLRLSRVPVLPDSIEIVSEESIPANDGFADETIERPWQRVDDLQSSGPNDNSYELDSTTGLVTFGDGNHGAALPQGFRHVRAKRYAVSSGSQSAVAADEVKILLSSAPFVTAVTNPLKLSGGTDREAQVATILRGPETLRARNRSVAAADYAVMAHSAPGASVGRAHALSGYHPLFPGRPIPGVVGLLIISRRAELGPPVPDELTLQAVAKYVSSKFSPAGIEVVACAPIFRSIRAEVGFVADRDSDFGAIARDIEKVISRFLDPLIGGVEGEGWPFGGSLVYSELIQLLMTADSTNRYQPPRAISRLRLVVDGAPQPKCENVVLKANELFWPQSHQVIGIETEVLA